MFAAGGHQFQVLARPEADGYIRGATTWPAMSLNTASPSNVLFGDFDLSLRAEARVAASPFANELNSCKQ